MDEALVRVSKGEYYAGRKEDMKFKRRLLVLCLLLNHWPAAMCAAVYRTKERAATRSELAQMSVAPPFSNIRFLNASDVLFRLLLQCTRLPALHSLSLAFTASQPQPGPYVEATPLEELLSSLPTLRRVRLDGWTSLDPLLSHPSMELLDFRSGFIRMSNNISGAPTPLSLTRLMMPHSGASTLLLPQLSSLVPTSIRQLTISVVLTNEYLQALTMLQSLTSLELYCCSLPDSHICTSLQRCRQLLSLCYYTASVVATEAASTQTSSSSTSTSTSSTTSSFSSPASQPPAVTFPSLVYLGLVFRYCGAYVDYAGFTRLIGLSAASPIRSAAIVLPRGANHRAYIRQLAVLSHLDRVMLGEGWKTRVDEEEEEQQPGERVFDEAESAFDVLQRCTDEASWTAEQHAVRMRYYWQDGLPEEREELIAKYKIGVKAPVAWSECDAVGDPYAVYRRFRSSWEGDARSAFFQALDDNASPISALPHAVQLC